MTHANVDYAGLEARLKAFLAKQLGTVEILSVSIDDDIELDDERVLEISVTFAGTPQDLVAAHPLGLNGLLQDELVTLHAPAFPVLSFIPSPAT